MDEQDNGVQEANPFDGETLKLRFQERDEHMSEAQKKMYIPHTRYKHHGKRCVHHRFTYATRYRLGSYTDI